MRERTDKKERERKEGGWGGADGNRSEDIENERDVCLTRRRNELG